MIPANDSGAAMTFETFIETAQPFYRTLAANNSKDWWEANRATYDKEIKPTALALLDEITPRLSDLLGDPVTTKLFRPHRDTRFSKDKTPYKTHLHVLWQVNEGRQPVAYFFGIEPDQVRIGGGMMAMEKDVLDDWRKFVDLDAPRVARIVDGVKTAGFSLREPELVRVPRGYAPDHPNADLLRHKSVIATRPLGGTGPLCDRIMDGLKEFKPLGDLLLSVACA